MKIVGQRNRNTKYNYKNYDPIGEDSILNPKKYNPPQEDNTNTFIINKNKKKKKVRSSYYLTR